MPDEFIKIPASQRIGQINNSKLSYQVGSIIGEELKSFGLNMDFGPVLDINSNPKNPVIGDRAFGADAGIVSQLGIQTMKGLQSQNMSKNRSNPRETCEIAPAYIEAYSTSRKTIRYILIGDGSAYQLQGGQDHGQR